MTPLNPHTLPLQRAYHWEKARADKVFLTQPLGGAAVRDWTWTQAMDEARRVAAFLLAQDWPAGSRIAIMSKNTAWWVMADLAIWMAGHVSVPIYPNLVADSVRQILEHSETRLCIVGKLDDWAAMQPGIPANLPCIGTPLCAANGFQQWDEVVRSYAPMPGNPTVAEDAIATIIYTSGTTGAPKGAVHGFGAFAHTALALQKIVGINENARALSYLPLAHVAERAIVEATGLQFGSRIFFAESLGTFMADLQRAQPTFFFSVPRLWVRFQQGVLAKVSPKKLDRLMAIPMVGTLVKRKILKQLGLHSVRFAGTGAAPLPPDVKAYPQPFALVMLPAGHWELMRGADARMAFSAELSAHVDLVNQQLDPHERLDFIAVVSDQWTVEAGFVTPTLKLKRHVLEKHYEPYFDRWAKVRQVVVWHEDSPLA